MLRKTPTAVPVRTDPDQVELVTQDNEHICFISLETHDRIQDLADDAGVTFEEFFNELLLEIVQSSTSMDSSDDEVEDAEDETAEESSGRDPQEDSRESTRDPSQQEDGSG